MNHKVQVFMSGCFTLKFETSWKTVTFSVVPTAGLVFSSLVAPPFRAGSGTGVACMTSVMMEAVDGQNTRWRNFNQVRKMKREN